MSIKTVSLEMAKKLKDAGFKKDTYWSFTKHKLHDYYKLRNYSNNQWIEDVIPAPTTDELLEELPLFEMGADIYKTHSKWEIACTIPRRIEAHESLTEALASIWLWLRGERIV